MGATSIDQRRWSFAQQDEKNGLVQYSLYALHGDEEHLYQVTDRSTANGQTFTATVHYQMRSSTGRTVLAMLSGQVSINDGEEQLLVFVLEKKGRDLVIRPSIIFIPDDEQVLSEFFLGLSPCEQLALFVNPA